MLQSRRVSLTSSRLHEMRSDDQTSTANTKPYSNIPLHRPATESRCKLLKNIETSGGGTSGSTLGIGKRSDRQSASLRNVQTHRQNDAGFLASEPPSPRPSRWNSRTARYPVRPGVRRPESRMDPASRVSRGLAHLPPGSVQVVDADEEVR